MTMLVVVKSNIIKIHKILFYTTIIYKMPFKHVMCFFFSKQLNKLNEVNIEYHNYYKMISVFLQ